MTIGLFLSTSLTLDSAAKGLASFHASVNIAPSASTTLVLKAPAFPSVPQGTYFLLAEVTGAGSPGSVAGTTANRIALSPPFTDLSIEQFSISPPALVRGRPATLELTLANVGDGPFTGVVNATLSEQSDAPGAASLPPLPLATIPLRVSLKPDARKVFHLKDLIPADAVTGPVVPVITISTSASDDPSNNALSGTATTIS